MILGHVREQIERALRVRQPVRMNDVGLRAVARLRIVDDGRLPQLQRRFERTSDDELAMGRVGVGRGARGIGLRREDTRKLVEKLPHVRRQDRGELLEGAFDVVSERRPRQRFEERAAEMERAQLRQRQAGGEALERLAVHVPPRPPVVVRSIVVEREAGFLERLQVAADGARGDAAERREIVDGHPGAARAFNLAQDGPLADDLRVPGHGMILRCSRRSAIPPNSGRDTRRANG